MSQTVRVHLALLAVSLIYGFFYIAMKLLLRELAQAELILLRFVLTAVIVGVIEWWFYRTQFNNVKEALKLMGLGLLGVFLVQILIVMGVRQTTAFHSALIMSTIPILTLLFSLLSGREVFRVQKVLGIVLAFTGVSVLFFANTDSLHSPLPSTFVTGDVLILLAAAAFSWYLIMSQSMLKTYNSYSLMAYCYIISAIAITLTFSGMAFMEGKMLSFFEIAKHLSGSGWALIGYVVIFASIISYTLNNYALRRATPSMVSSYIFVQPVLSAVLGYYMLGEPLNRYMWLSVIVTSIGVYLATSASHKDFLESSSSPP